MKRNWILFFLLFFSAAAFSQKKYDAQLKKADAKYESGYYAKAIKQLEKFKKLIGRLGKENAYTPIFYLREARYYWASGLVSGFDVSLENAAKTAQNVYGEYSEKHLDILLEISDAYMSYGNFLEASEYLNSVQENLNSEVHSEALFARSKLFHGKILSEQGYYKDALKYIQEVESYFKNRLNTKEQYLDDKGKEHTRKLTEEELRQRYSDYAQIISFKARTYGKMGNLEQGYNHYESARDWIAKESKFLGPKSFEYVSHEFSFAQFKVENGLDPELLGKGIHKEESYYKILDKLKKSHNEGHLLAFEIYEALLKQYLMNRQASRYRNMKIDYEKALNKNFHKNSLHQINLQKLDFNSRLDRDKTNNLEDRAHSLLANTQSLPQNHKIRIDILEFLYRVAIKERNFGRAEEYLQNIIDIQAALYGEHAPITHLARVDLANFYVDYTNNITLAEEIYQKSFYSVINKEVNSMHPDYLNILTHLATMKEFQDKPQEAGELLDEAVRISLEKFRDLEDMEYAKVLEKVASLQINMGDYEKGNENIEKVLDVYKNKKIKNDEYNVVHLVKAQETQARLYVIEGYFDKAEELINDSQDLLEDARTLEGYNTFEITDELSALYIYLGHYSKSEELLDDLILEYEKIYGVNSGRIVKTLINKGRLDILLGNYSEAEKISQRAYKIAVEVFGENSTKTAQTMLLLGELYTTIGDYEKAIDNISRGLAIQEERYGRGHINVALNLSQLGIARFYNNDNFEEVEKIMLEARETISKTLSNKNPRYAEVSTNLAKVYIQSNKLSEAFKALSEAQQIWIEITGQRGSSRNVNIGRIDVLVGDVYYQNKNYAKAEENYIKARDNFKKSLNTHHPEYVKTQTKLSRVYFMDGKTQLAKELIESALISYNDYIDRYFKSLSEREKAKFWNTIKPDFEYYNTVALTFLEQDPAVIGKLYNNALNTKALLLSSSIRVRERILNSGDELLIESYQAWLDKKEDLTKAFSLNDEQLQSSGINLAKLSQEVETLEKGLSEQSEVFSSDLEQDKVNWQNVKSALKDNEVAIEMVRFRYFNHVFTDSVIYAVMYLKKDANQKVPSVILMKNGQNLETRSFRYYNIAIQNRIQDNNSYGTYWEPIVSEIGSLSTIYLSADGVYNQINLEAIPISDGKYVIDNSNIVVISNTKDLYLKAREKQSQGSKERSALMFGNPDYYLTANNSGKVFALPGTEKEVTQLRRLLSNNGFESDYYTKDEATEDQVKAVVSPSVLHIATHGFFNAETKKSSEFTLNDNDASNNPLLQTGLVLTGGGDVLDQTSFNYNLESGILTAYEAMNLNLEGTDLVVLSACETGLGKLEIGEGVYGLQRAFLVAGAKTLIMSMFKVDDAATQELMVSFYNKWMETGNKRQAFIDAKKEIRVKYEYPIFWGAFIMIGLD